MKRTLSLLVCGELGCVPFIDNLEDLEWWCQQLFGENRGSNVFVAEEELWSAYGGWEIPAQWF